MQAQAAKNPGFKLDVVRLKIGADPTPSVARVVGLKPDVVFTAAAGSAAVAVYRAFQQQGFPADKIVNTGATVDEETFFSKVDQAAVEGSLLLLRVRDLRRHVEPGGQGVPRRDEGALRRRRQERVLPVGLRRRDDRLQHRQEDRWRQAQPEVLPRLLQEHRGREGLHGRRAVQEVRARRPRRRSSSRRSASSSTRAARSCPCPTGSSTRSKATRPLRGSCPRTPVRLARGGRAFVISGGFTGAPRVCAAMATIALDAYREIRAAESETPGLPEVLDCFAEVIEAIDSEAALDEILHLVARKICMLVECSRCGVYLKHSDTGLYRGQVIESSRDGRRRAHPPADLRDGRRPAHAGGARDAGARLRPQRARTTRARSARSCRRGASARSSACR